MAKNSLSRMAMRAMSIRITMVVMLVAIAGFWHNYNLVEELTILELKTYVEERVEREALHFKFAANNVALFASTFQHKLTEDNRDYTKEFNKLFIIQPDGTYAPVSKNNPVQMYLKSGVTLTPHTKKNIVLLNDLLLEFGLAWSANFTNIWVAGLEDYGLTFWPSRPQALSGLPNDHSFLIHEYMKIGLPQNNPNGEPRWTGPYFDIMSQDWMISINHPVYHEGKYLLSVGMDILLNDFYERSINNILVETYNLVFMKDGRLVSHPSYLEDIKKAGGVYYIQNQEDKILKNILTSVSGSRSSIIEDEENALFLGTGKIEGPDWWFVLVYPKKNLFNMARNTALFLGLIGLISLLIELIFLQQVIQKYVSQPIRKLIEASNKIAQGDNQARVEVDAKNEIGHLANSFNLMGEKVLERDKLLSQQASQLELDVKQRTEELDLQRAKAFHAAKMATLGEIAAGIAHEINNPLSTISLSAGGIKKRLQPNALDNDKLIEYVTKIETTSERISKIVKGMRAFSRNAEHDQKVPISVANIIESAMDLCQEKLKKDQVKLECTRLSNSKVLCRETEIIQTLLNLIQNSIDAISLLSDKHISIWCEEDDSSVSIIVQDNGPGVPKEIEDKIMNPFFTTKEVGKGTGLGLFISLGLIESNGGSLKLEQSTGQTKFIVTLPKALS